MENGNGCALTFHYQNPIEYTVCCVCGVLIICIHSNIIDCMKCDKSVCVCVGVCFYVEEWHGQSQIQLRPYGFLLLYANPMTRNRLVSYGIYYPV